MINRFISFNKLLFKKDAVLNESTKMSSNQILSQHREEMLMGKLDKTKSISPEKSVQEMPVVSEAIPEFVAQNKSIASQQQILINPENNFLNSSQALDFKSSDDIKSPASLQASLEENNLSIIDQHKEIQFETGLYDSFWLK